MQEQSILSEEVPGSPYSPNAVPETIEQRMFEEQVSHAEKLIPLATIGSLVNGLIVCMILRSQVPSSRLLWWILAILLVSIFRYPGVYRKFGPLSLQSDARSLGRYFMALALLSGLAWGSSAVFLFPADSIIHQAFLAFVLAGMVAGAVGIYAALAEAFTAFAVPTLLPFMLRCWLIGDAVHFAMAAMALLFGVLMWITTRRMNAVVRSNIRLTFENQDLAEYLTSAKQRVENFNAKLHLEITERKKVENDLRRHKTHLSELVEERTMELTEINERLQREIDERQRLEDQLLRTAKLDSLGLLAGGIAHDFNNLLMGILGNISLALTETSPESALHDTLSEAERASFLAKDLTQQLLTFSQGGVPVKKTVCLQGLLEDAVKFALRGSNVRYELDLEKDLWPVEADEGQMSQVFHNIIINAQQAMLRGGLIQVNAQNIQNDPRCCPPLLPGNKCVKVAITDHGPGIADSDLPRIFDPYFSTKKDGRGLGLATTHSIVKKHEGHITVDSEPDAGTTFHIFLPASENRSAENDCEKNRTLAVGQGKVLIMDDDASVRRVISMMLKTLGYEVASVEDGAQALDAYKQAMESGQGFDAVIMDLTIPGGMGGLEAVERLLDLDPQARALVSSGYSNDPVMARYGDYGFKNVIQKPYMIHDLSRRLSEVIDAEITEKSIDSKPAG